MLTIIIIFSAINYVVPRSTELGILVSLFTDASPGDRDSAWHRVGAQQTFAGWMNKLALLDRNKLPGPLGCFISPVRFSRYHFPIPRGTDSAGRGWGGPEPCILMGSPRLSCFPSVQEPQHWVIQVSVTSPSFPSSSPVPFQLQSSKSPILASEMIPAPELILFS